MSAVKKTDGCGVNKGALSSHFLFSNSKECSFYFIFFSTSFLNWEILAGCGGTYLLPPTGFLCGALAILELVLHTRQGLNSEICLTPAGIKGVCDQIQLKRGVFSKWQPLKNRTVQVQGYEDCETPLTISSAARRLQILILDKRLSLP